jgi:hypothetical protein
MDLMIVLNGLDLQEDKMTDDTPPGIKLLMDSPRSEEDTVALLRQCCESYPKGCGREEECYRRYLLKGGIWGPPKGWHDPVPKRVPERQKYCDYLPTLDRRAVISTLRERPIY